MKILVLAGFIFFCQAIGLLGSIPNIRAIPGWYASLKRPSWTPPNRVFAPVWTSLYLLMAIAAWKCWSARGFDDWLWPFLAQLALNLVWSYIFFGLRQIALALAEMILLWASIAWCIFGFSRIDGLAALLLGPYLLWVTYALTLNAGFFALNRRPRI